MRIEWVFSLLGRRVLSTSMLRNVRFEERWSKLSNGTCSFQNNWAANSCGWPVLYKYGSPELFQLTRHSCIWGGLPFSQKVFIEVWLTCECLWMWSVPLCLLSLLWHSQATAKLTYLPLPTGAKTHQHRYIFSKLWSHSHTKCFWDFLTLTSDISFMLSLWTKLFLLIYISSLGVLALGSVPFDSNYFQVLVLSHFRRTWNSVPAMLKGSSNPSRICYQPFVYTITDSSMWYRKLQSTPQIPQS